MPMPRQRAVAGRASVRRYSPRPGTSTQPREIGAMRQVRAAVRAAPSPPSPGAAPRAPLATCRPARPKARPCPLQRPVAQQQAEQIAFRPSRSATRRPTMPPRDDRAAGSRRPARSSPASRHSQSSDHRVRRVTRRSAMIGGKPKRVPFACRQTHHRLDAGREKTRGRRWATRSPSTTAVNGLPTQIRDLARARRRSCTQVSAVTHGLVAAIVSQ